jgi:L-ribulose-5-phosphate 4-epimerase
MSDALMETLIKAGLILATEGHSDHVFGHVTARLPNDPTRFLMKSTVAGFEEMTPENIIVADIEGRKVSGGPHLPSEVFIHSEVMRARPEMQAVVHTHAPHSVIFSTLGRKLVPVAHEGAYFVEGLPVFSETTDLIINQRLGKALSDCLAEHQAALLQNHGIVTCGRSIEEAVFFAMALEKACEMQLMAEACGGPKLVTNPEEARIKRARNCTSGAYQNVFAYAGRKAERFYRQT